MELFEKNILNKFINSNVNIINISKQKFGSLLSIVNETYYCKYFKEIPHIKRSTNNEFIITV